MCSSAPFLKSSTYLSKYGFAHHGNFVNDKQPATMQVFFELLERWALQRVQLTRSCIDISKPKELVQSCGTQTDIAGSDASVSSDPHFPEPCVFLMAQYGL